jgi:hypothetical protein
MMIQACHGELFEPPLPPEKLKAMGGISIGTVDKIFLDFSSCQGHFQLSCL